MTEEVRAPQEMCPYIGRYGVCLEPVVCDLKHKRFDNLDAPSFEFKPQMTTNVSDFVPTAPAAEESKQIDPKDQMASKGLNITETMAEDGSNFYGSLMTVEERKSCKCCHGDVNNCDGEECAFLGICFCVVVDEDDYQGLNRQT